MVDSDKRLGCFLLLLWQLAVAHKAQKCVRSIEGIVQANRSIRHMVITLTHEPVEPMLQYMVVWCCTEGVHVGQEVGSFSIAPEAINPHSPKAVGLCREMMQVLRDSGDAPNNNLEPKMGTKPYRAGEPTEGSILERGGD